LDATACKAGLRFLEVKVRDLVVAVVEVVVIEEEEEE
jgi:hypothetical protein